MEGKQTASEIRKEFTCSQRGCKKECEEIHSFSSYHQKAARQNLVGKPFCEKCFEKKEAELK